jgi:hypothetical protein
MQTQKQKFKQARISLPLSTVILYLATYTFLKHSQSTDIHLFINIKGEGKVVTVL